MAFKHADQQLASVSDLLERLTADRIHGPTWFRGLPDASWHLTSTLARHPGGIAAELTLVKRFKQNALPFIQHRPQTEWEWLFVMQHHALPTRLLDWSESPLVALYFVVADQDHEAEDGALWALAPLELNLSSKYKADHENDIPGFGDDTHLDSYLTSDMAKQKQALPPLAAIAMRNNPRLQVQQGVFTVHHLEPTPLNNGEPDYLWRYIVPASSKARLREELTLLNVAKLTLFPELTNVAEHAKAF